MSIDFATTSILTEALQTLTLRAGFNTTLVIIGTTLLGIASGCIGCFALLRKRTLMSDALSHCALPGLAGAYLLAISLWGSERSLGLLLAGAGVSGFLGILAVQGIIAHSRIREDAAIGIVLSVFFGAGVVLMSIIQDLGRGNAAGLSHFIYGQTAALTSVDLLMMAAAAIIVFAACLLLLKEFTLLCFDADFCEVQGWPLVKLDFFLLALITLVTLVGLQAVGIILVIALISIPAAAARFWTERLTGMFVGSAVIGGLSGYCGAAISAVIPHLPTGSVIVVTAGTLFMLSMLFAPCRGLLAERYRAYVVRLRVLEEHILRSSYEYLEQQGALAGANSTAVPINALPSIRTRPPLMVWLFLTQLARLGFLNRHGSAHIVLEEKGLERGKELTANHRLWEHYLAKQDTVLISHIDYSADLVEHVLSPSLVAELKRELADMVAAMPESLHPIATSTIGREAE
jgi:manganese/zinc/iron transport system permease protein